MKRILLAVITEGDLCIAHFCSSLAQSIRAGLPNNVEFLPVFFAANGNWSMAFNQAATLAWKEKLDGLVCIHPFVSWNPADLIQFVQTDKDAVALPVATRNGFEIQLGKIARLQEDTNSGEIKVQGTSLDFFYLSPYALSRLCDTHPTIQYRGADVKLILQSGDIYGAYFDPCDILGYRLREQGIETWVSSKMTAYRQETIEYTNDFSTVLKNLREQ